jgi:type IV pilus assembly protein PilW
MTVPCGRTPSGRGTEAGWTLVELVISLAIMTFLAAGVLAVWGEGQKAYFVSSEVAEIGGDARIAIDQMIRDIRKAGRDVTQCAFDSEAYTDCSAAKLARCQSLLGGSFTCNNVWIIPAATGTSLQIQSDLNGDGVIDTCDPSDPLCPASGESITFAYDAGSRRITRQQGTGTAETLAPNIDSLAFAYEGPASPAGVCTGTWGAITPTTQTLRDCVQRITITVVAGSTLGAVGSIDRTIQGTTDLRTR